MVIRMKFNFFSEEGNIISSKDYKTLKEITTNIQYLDYMVIRQ